MTVDNAPTNDVADIRDDLDNYGSNLPVYIEDLNGNLRVVGEIYTRTLPEGVAVVIVSGPLKEY